MQQPPDEGTPQYAQPPPYQQFPYQQPPRRRRRWPFVLLGILVLACALIGIIALASQGGTPSTSTTTTSTVPTKPSTPTTQPKLTTVQTFQGNGSKKTAIFHVPDDWMLVWKCDPASFMGDQYNVVITIYNSDNTLSDVSINTICKTGNTSDSTEIHMSGDIYLSVDSEAAWTVEIQELT